MVGGGELPPSYDSIMKNSDFPPPPYLSVLIYNEKNDTVPEVNDKEQNIQTITNTEPSFNQERSQESSQQQEQQQQQHHQLQTG